MNVRLSGEDERFVSREVASGRYESTQEVVRDSLRLLQEQKIVEKRRRIKLNAQIEEGLAELDRGEWTPSDQVFQALREKSRRRRHQTS